MTDEGNQELWERAQAGDKSAAARLLDDYRDRLRRMVFCRMDPRVAARVDASDIVQESLIEAGTKWDDYLQHREVPLYAWLRRVCWQRLVKLHEFHLNAAKRSARREQNVGVALPDHSSVMLMGQLVGRQITPSKELVKQEMVQTVRSAMQQLPNNDQEVLVMRYLEQMSSKEIAACLDISEPAVNMRHMRALERLRGLLGDE